MKGLLALLICCVTLQGYAADNVSSSRTSVFRALKVGQNVSMKDVSNGVEINLLNDGAQPMGYVIVEIGPDYLVLEDLAPISTSWFPVTSIRKIVHTRLPQ